MEELNIYGESLEATVSKENLYELCSDLSDITLDMLSNTGENLPIFSLIFKGIKTVNSIRDYIFMEKVIAFLSKISEIPFEKRIKIIHKINSDSNYSQKFGKFSLIALERYDDKIKALYLGNAAKYLANEQISFEFYQRFSFIISRLFTADIEKFKNQSFTSFANPAFADFESLGLLRVTLSLPELDFTKKINSNSSKRNIKETSRHLTIWGLAVRNILTGQSINFQTSMSLETLSSHLK